MKEIDYSKLDGSCIELENSLEILKCFDDFVSNEGTFLGKDIEEDKIAAFAFMNRIPQYRPLLLAAMDKIDNEIKNIKQATNDFCPCKTVLNNSENNGVAQIPVLKIRMMSDYEWQEKALKERREHPERYEKTENVAETIAYLEKWLEEHKSEAEECAEC